MHSVHSSVISDYSRRTSEVISPSDLPESPFSPRSKEKTIAAAMSKGSFDFDVSLSDDDEKLLEETIATAMPKNSSQ
jgi:hypothetical protein